MVRENGDDRIVFHAHGVGEIVSATSPIGRTCPIVVIAGMGENGYTKTYSKHSVRISGHRAPYPSLRDVPSANRFTSMAAPSNSSRIQTREPLSKSAAIRNHLVSELTAGRLKPGSILPAESSLAESFQVARNTVRQALAEMEQQGFLRREQGRGTFVQEHARALLGRSLQVFALAAYDMQLPYFTSMLRGFEAANASSSIQTIACSTYNDVDKQASVILKLMDQNVEGLAIVPVANDLTSPHQIRQVQERGIPVVLCRRSVADCRAPVVAVPFDQVGRLAGEALLEQGHRRIGFLLVGAKSNVGAIYESGLREAMRTADPSAELLVHRCPRSGPGVVAADDAVIEALEKFFDSPHPVTALFVSHDTLAEKAYLLAKQRGLRLPEDISLVGFGDSCRRGAIAERLTSVVVDDAEIGRQAATLLWEIRSGKRDLYDTERIMMPLSLSEGHTLGPAPGKEERTLSAGWQ
jgi:GntR family transcriptional regulator, arabinose operon transcriptional repressor